MTLQECTKEDRIFMNRNNNFGIIHFLAALGVMFAHQFEFMGFEQPRIILMELGAFSVRMIMVIVGYLITESWQNSKSTEEYILKRIRRIFPPLALSVVVTVALIGVLCSTGSFLEYLDSAQAYVFYNVCLYPIFNIPGIFADNFYPNAVNGSLWTLPIEFACYFLLIVLMKVYDVLGKYGKVFYTILLGAMWVIYVLQITPHMPGSYVVWGTDWFNSVQIAVYFFAGSLISKLKLQKYLKIWVAALLFGGAVLLSKTEGLFYDYLLAISYLPVITYVTMALALPKKAWFSKFKGKLSYEIYLYAFPIQQILVQLLMIRGGKTYSVAVMFGMAFVVTLVISWLSSKVIQFLSEGKYLFVAGKTKKLS